MTDFLTLLTGLATTGRLGELHYGASLPELAARYGDPWDGGRIHRDRRWPHAFGFGDVQTVFCRCRELRSLSLPIWHGELELPQRAGESVTLPTRVTETELMAALTAGGRPWQTITYENLPDQRNLLLSPAEELRVELVLTNRECHDEPPSEEWVLHKAVMWGYDHADCPEPDRSLPDDGWGAAEL
ncbi:hypothetical protein ATKI12_5814 [Kitasatospora sp. Ki12]|uniref:hypothetical protein n=1 Tax=Kitasatospora xanthocidica TaxID=83382 RepID=UPI001679784B|nr:hypothetical protein [Kitasatospora xanthocidica]GHF53449.1 hypothetical protein GCM10018790_34050 [Kitasatospora xanthocidica]